MYGILLYEIEIEHFLLQIGSRQYSEFLGFYYGILISVFTSVFLYLW